MWITYYTFETVTLGAQLQLNSEQLGLAGSGTIYGRVVFQFILTCSSVVKRFIS